MSKMKLGTKIAFGFGLLLLIAVVLGCVAIWQMTGTQKISTRLANEYVPEVAVGNNIERYSLKTMFAMRGYSLSEDESYLQTARTELAEVKRYLKEAGALAAKYPLLVVLRDQVGKADTKVAEYEKLVENTVEKNKGIQRNRLAMDEAAASYMKNCYEFLESQNEAIKDEIAQGVTGNGLVERLQKITLTNDIIDAGNAVRLTAFKAQALRAPDMIRNAQGNFDTINQQLDQLKAITRKQVNLQQIEETRAAAGAYKNAMNALLANWLDLEKINTERNDTAFVVLGVAEETSTAALKGTETLANDAMNGMSMATTIMIIGLIAAAIIGILAAFVITRSITKPLTRAIDGLNEGSDQVASAAGQVSSASQQLAEGASEQAASVEETSSSLEEMNAMTRQNADNASQANSLMEEAKATVGRAAGSMKEMTRAMDDIANSGQEISKIIKTIDEIAFQTNLLALNAAVEAARAGDAGMGFAVVADEVRNLAQRSAEAAKNTAELIEGTIAKIGQGTGLVKTADQAFTEVSQSSGKVAELVGEIAAASAEQAQGIDQINQAVAQMDKVTQRNAANAEESASASEELNAQAETMRDIVSELAGMIGGANVARAVSRPAVRRPAVKKTRSLPVHTTRKSTERAPVPKHAAPARAREMAPDDVIPMDDDFGEF